MRTQVIIVATCLALVASCNRKPSSPAADDAAGRQRTGDTSRGTAPRHDGTRRPTIALSRRPYKAPGASEFLGYLPRSTSLIVSARSIRRLAQLFELDQLKSRLPAELASLTAMTATLGFDPLQVTTYGKSGIDVDKPCGLLVFSGEPTLVGLFFGVTRQSALIDLLRRTPAKVFDLLPMGKETTILRWKPIGITLVLRGGVAIAIATLGAPSLDSTTKLAQRIAGLGRKDSLAANGTRVADFRRGSDCWGEIRSSAVRDAVDARVEAMPGEIEREQQKWRRAILETQLRTFKAMRNILDGLGPLRFSGTAGVNALQIDWTIAVGQKSWLHGIYKAPAAPILSTRLTDAPMFQLRLHVEPKTLWGLVQRITKTVSPENQTEAFVALDKLLLKPVSAFWLPQLEGTLELAVLPGRKSGPPDLVAAARLSSDTAEKALAPLLAAAGVTTRKVGTTTVYRVPLTRVFGPTNLDFAFSGRKLILATNPQQLDRILTGTSGKGFVAALPGRLGTEYLASRSLFLGWDIGLFGWFVGIQRNVIIHKIGRTMRFRYLAQARTKKDKALVGRITKLVDEIETLERGELERGAKLTRAIFRRFGGVAAGADVVGSKASGRFVWQVRAPSLAVMLVATIRDLAGNERLEKQHRETVQKKHKAISEMIRDAK